MRVIRVNSQVRRPTIPFPALQALRRLAVMDRENVKSESVEVGLQRPVTQKTREMFLDSLFRPPLPYIFDISDGSLNGVDLAL